jgi:hypothetical protein
MTQIVLSNDLNVITAEINSYKQVAGQSIFEIGKRLKHVKENDLVHGEFGKWSDSLGFSSKHVSRYIQAYDQFSPTSGNLSTSKIFEMLSLPDSVDRSEFIEENHVIPSTGESKKVDDMTVRELREVKAALKESEKTISHLSEKLEEEMNKPEQVITVEKIPDDYQQIMKDHQRLNNENVQLYRTNQQLNSQITENKSTSTSLRKLKEYCSESISTVSASNAALLFELSALEGNSEARKIADEYGNQLSETTNKFFKELKEIMEVQKTY